MKWEWGEMGTERPERIGMGDALPEELEAFIGRFVIRPRRERSLAKPESFFRSLHHGL